MRDQETVTGGRTRLGRGERRQQIVAAAIEAFASGGYSATRMEDVARTAGINVALIYQHFVRKDDLFEAIFADLYLDNPMLRELESLAAGNDDRAIFTFVAESYSRLPHRDIAIQRILLSAALERPDLYRRHFTERESNVVAILSDYIGRRVTEGTFRPVVPDLVARLFTAQAYVYMLESRSLEGVRWRGLQSEAVTAAMVDVFLAGLRNQG